MAEIYGHKWVSSYGDKPNFAWISGLRDIPSSSIKYGLEHIIKSGDGWPPSLPEFIEYCLGISRSAVITEIHKTYVDSLSTYSQIERVERDNFQEERQKLIINQTYIQKHEYINSLDDKQIKALENND